MTNEKLAEQIATRDYLINGHYGGKGKNQNGKMSIQYFDFKSAKEKALQSLENIKK